MLKLLKIGMKVPNNYFFLFFNLFLTFSRIFFAHANSVAKIPSPIGMIMNAGPGKTINNTPIKRMVKPIIPTIIFFILLYQY